MTIRTIALVTATVLIFGNYAKATTQTWGNGAGTGTDFNTAADWNAGAGPVPSTSDTALFSGNGSLSPNLSGSLTMVGLNFSVGGYTLSNSNSAILTLSGTGSGTSSSIDATNTSGTNTISAPVLLSGATNASTSYITQAAGGTLNISTLNGTIGGGSSPGSLILSSGSTGGITIGSMTAASAGASSLGALQSSGNNTVTSLTLSSATRIAVNSGTLTVTNGIAGGSTLRILGSGTLVLDGNDTGINGLDLGVSGTAYSAVVEIGNAGALGSSTVLFDSNSSATLESSSSSAYTIANNLSVGSGAVSEIFGAVGTGNLTFGGTVTLSTGFNATVNNSNTTFGGAISGSGDVLTKTGAGTMTLSVANSYTGGTTVTAGKLLANGSSSSTGSGAVSVGASGTLGGTGTIAPTGMTTGKAVDVSGALSPGNGNEGTTAGVGTLTFSLSGTSIMDLESGSTFTFDLAGTGASDEVAISGGSSTAALTLNGQQFSNFTFNELTGFGPGTYVLFDTGAASDIAGSLGTTVSGSLAGGYTGTLMLGSTGGDEAVELVVAPESSAWAMILGGLAVLVLVQRRKKYQQS